MSAPQLLPIEINQEKKTNEILTNIIKMLTNRKLLKRENLEKNIKDLISQEADDTVYKIKLDYPKVYYGENDNTLYVKLLNQKITGVAKTSNIGDFLYEYRNHPKIIVANSITGKAHSQLISEFRHSEVFVERELMMDIVSHISVPKHELLSYEEAEKVLGEYDTKKREMPKIFITDPVAKYFNAQLGQIFRITRPSETSGLAPYYRLVIKGNIVDKK